LSASPVGEVAGFGC